MPDFKIQGAREHSLKNISLTIPAHQLVVITGPSGSGKSSLAFDTLFAEGQRRYMESLSSSARKFLERLPRPDVDLIEGVAPAIAIGQERSQANPRAIVATTTELYDYWRLLFTALGVPHDPTTGEVLSRRSLTTIVDEIWAFPAESRLMILAPYPYEEEETLLELSQRAQRAGFLRLRINGELLDAGQGDAFLAALNSLGEKNPRVEVVIDRLILRQQKGSLRDRLYDSTETALRLGQDAFLLLVALPKNDQELRVKKEKEDVWQEHFFSTDFYYAPTQFRMEPLTPEHFSFNSRQGACPHCHGLGVEPLKEGSASSVEQPCHQCHGKRLRPEILAVTLASEGEKTAWNIEELLSLSILEMAKVFFQLKIEQQQRELLEDVLAAIEGRLRFLIEVGVGYLQLNRRTSTLSGGEFQRLRLARQMSSQLSGILYVLDEPTIGLHPYDHHRLLQALLHLRDLGNSLIVVEHDMQMMEAADFLIELGPGAGEKGGNLLALGKPQQIKAHPSSVTGAYLRGDLSLKKEVQKKNAQKNQNESVSVRRNDTGHLNPNQDPDQEWVGLLGATQHHLKDIDFTFPLGCLTGLSGLSGSGKSTLMHQLLYPALKQKLARKPLRLSGMRDLVGWESLEEVIMIDQQPIGRSPRSNPATYLGILDLLRELFASLPAARMRGYDAGYFSFNKKGGRCEVCRGEGVERLKMQFLADIFVPCQACHGKRFRRETLEITFKGKSIADYLDLSVEQAMELLRHQPKIIAKLQALLEVGLGYLRLGQPATTLSGGEAQRLKLARELAKKESGKTLYLLDEPTTGLHINDIIQLMKLLFRLRDKGNTLLIIEHHPEVLGMVDWLVDLGPGGGDQGGEVLIAGTPEQVASCPKSITGSFLKKDY